MKTYSGVSIGVVESATKQDGGYRIQVGEGPDVVLIRLTAQNGVLEIDTYLPANEFATSAAKFLY